MIDHLTALAVHAFYVGEHEVGRRACERLLSLPDLPHEIELMARENRTWYTPTLDELADTSFMRLAVDPAQEGWSTFNPTILLLPASRDFLAIVRSSNYRIFDGRYEIPPEDGGTIRTKNILVHLGRDLSVRSARVLEDPAYAKTSYPVDGLEDCRLRWAADGSIGVSAVVRNVAPWEDGRCRQATARIDVSAAALTDLLVLEGLQEHEKNWMPIVGVAGWLHSCSHDGHTVTIEEVAPNQFDVLRRLAVPPVARSWRGGGQLVPLNGGYLAVIHEVAPCGPHRAYEHRFVWFDNAFRLKLASPPFVFQAPRQIEFAAGIAADGGRVVVTFGVRDAEAWLVELVEEQVWRLLRPLSSPGTSG